MKDRITIHVCTRDRHSEIALCLESLRKQTIKNWDLMILDDGSGTSLTVHNPTMQLIQRIKLEGHRAVMIRNNISQGVCVARQTLLDKDDFNNMYCARIDDDVVLEPDYLEKLMEVINNGYDLATGVVPLTQTPDFERDVKFVGDIICRHDLDNEGNIISRKDELGYCYIQSKILPCDQFRTNCLMKTEVAKKVSYPKMLTRVGFREEGFFSFSAIINGFKIGAHTGAIAYHLQTPSGGCRSTTYMQDVQLDDETFQRWIKDMFNKHGNFLERYHKDVTN